MEETTVTGGAGQEELQDQGATQESFQPATVFAFAPDADDAHPGMEAEAEPAGEEAPDADGQAEEPEEGNESGPFDGRNQKDIGNAFRLQKRDVEREAERRYQEQLQQDPNYRYGKLMHRYLMESEGLSEEEAVKVSMDRAIEAIAKSQGTTPMMVRVAFGLNQQAARPIQEQERDASPEEMAMNRANEAIEELNSMRLPTGFDLDRAVKDPAFAGLIQRYPTEAAVRIYAAEQSAKNAPEAVANKLRARQQLPQSMKPQKSATPSIDFASMSDEDFDKYVEKMKRNF